MKTITFKIAIFFLLFLSLNANAAAPTITLNPTAIVLDQSNTWTFDFTSSGLGLTGTESLVIYFWEPASHASVALTNVGGLKWALTFTPTTFFGKSVAQIAANTNQFYYNIQQIGVTGSISGTLHTTFTTPVLTTAPVSVTGSPKGAYPLDQPVTWNFDLTGSGFTAGMDVYMWAWTPTNPDAANWINSSAFAKLTYVSGMTWSKTLTPTTYFGASVATIQAATVFWMKLKDLTGKVETTSFNVPQTFSTTGIENNSQNSFEAYPNPVINDLTIKLKENNFDNISLYDFKGSLLRKSQIATGQLELKQNFESLGKGIYFLVLNGEKSSQTIKVIK
jgi:hypothetical protein